MQILILCVESEKKKPDYLETGKKGIYVTFLDVPFKLESHKFIML